MRPRRRTSHHGQPSGEPTRARCDLERKWFRRMSPEPRLATLVTARSAGSEAYHRWIPYRQGFSPELVRTYLREAGAVARLPGEGRGSPLPVLDPFSGSGTVVVECARRGVPALGVEPLRTLNFILSTMVLGECPPLPSLPESEDWRDFALVLEDPRHRAALMLAVARRYTGGGRHNRGAAPVGELLRQAIEMMREDLSFPLRGGLQVLTGDARRLDAVEDESVGGALTSPPYISRYDYAAQAKPMEEVFSFWFGPQPEGARNAMVHAVRPKSTHGHRRRPPTVKSPTLGPKEPAQGTRRVGDWGEPGTAAAVELCDWLTAIHRPRDAGLVADYLADQAAVMDSLRRVVACGSLSWIVVGGARIEGAYFPADLHLAELAEVYGWEVESILVARELVPNRRRFGDLGLLAPRESVVALRAR